MSNSDTSSTGTIPPRVTFLGENAGFRNTVGMYKIDPDGTIYDVQILFANASTTQSGGDLVAGNSFVEIDAGQGDQLGFFTLPDAYSLNDASVFAADRYELRDWGGSVGNIYDDSALRLYAINDSTGAATLVDARWNAATWHMQHDAEAGVDMNADGADHVRGQRMYDGSVSIGFSDVYGGGNGRFDSLLLNINLGDSGAFIEDTAIFDGSDQTDHNWIAPVDIADDLPEVAFAVQPRNAPLDLNGEADMGDDEGEAPATVTFMGEGAWYQSTFGMYKIDEQGTIYDIDILFSNASNAGSGGNLIAGTSSVEIDAQSGDDLGFFILSDAWRLNGDKTLFDADSYVLRDWNGNEGNIYWSTGLRLFAVDDETGQETLVNARFNGATWHMHHKPEDGIDMNVDGIDHLRGQLKYDGSITVGFEDIRNGGDRDYNDVMFNIDLGDSGAQIVDEGIFSGSDQRDNGFYTDDGAPASAKVTFLSETADHKNTLGMYKIADDGTISDVQILFANVSKYDSGGDLIAGDSSVDIDVDASDNLGFFLLPDGYAYNSDKSLFDDGTFVLRNDDGEAGNVFRDQGLKLYRVDEQTGAETLLHAKYGDTTYHMTFDQARGISLNTDSKDHGLGEIRDGNKVIIGFEDIHNNGDWDFDDVVVQVELSTTGARVEDQNLRTDDDADQSEVGWIFETNQDVFDIQPWVGENDRLSAIQSSGTVDADVGDDLVYGDHNGNGMLGNEGHDVLLGYGGDDALDGGAGDDHLNGGLGSDTLLGDGGRDRLWGGLGNDTMDGGAGDDKLWGGDGDDSVLGGFGDDRLFGNAGADTISGGNGADILFGGAGADTFLFAAEHLDGSINRIEDLALTGADSDLIDLRAAALLSEGQTTADWLGTNATGDGTDVSLDLGDGTLVLAGIGPVEDALQALESSVLL